MAGAIVLAIMTGPAGSNAAPTSGITGSLQFPRVLWFLGLGVVMFAVVSIWKLFGVTVRSRANRLRSSVVTVMTRRWVRLACDAAIIAFGFVWVTWIAPHDTWKGGICIQIGCAFAAMELVVYLYETRSLRLARLAATRSSPSTGRWHGCTTPSRST